MFTYNLVVEKLHSEFEKEFKRLTSKINGKNLFGTVFL